MTEIPINFYKDKRSKKSHLRTLQDGIRHLKTIINLKWRREERKKIRQR